MQRCPCWRSARSSNLLLPHLSLQVCFSSALTCLPFPVSLSSNPAISNTKQICPPLKEFDKYAHPNIICETFIFSLTYFNWFYDTLKIMPPLWKNNLAVSQKVNYGVIVWPSKSIPSNIWWCFLWNFPWWSKRKKKKKDNFICLVEPPNMKFVFSLACHFQTPSVDLNLISILFPHNTYTPTSTCSPFSSMFSFPCLSTWCNTVSSSQFMSYYFSSKT